MPQNVSWTIEALQILLLSCRLPCETLRHWLEKKGSLTNVYGEKLTLFFIVNLPPDTYGIFKFLLLTNNQRNNALPLPPLGRIAKWYSVSNTPASLPSVASGKRSDLRIKEQCEIYITRRKLHSGQFCTHTILRKAHRCKC